MIFCLKFLHYHKISIHIKDTFFSPFQIILVKMIRKANGFQPFSDCLIRRLRRQFSFKTAKSAVQSFHCTALFLIHKNEKTNIISARRARSVR